MTSGSELDIERNSHLDVGKNSDEAKTDEMNDSGHSSVNVSDPEGVLSTVTDDKGQQPTEKLVKITIQPSVGEPFDLHLNDNELVQELYQSLLDRESTCHRTCFTLHLNGHPIDNYSELRNIQGFTDGCTLVVVDEPFSIREARIHLRQIRELLRFGLNPDPHDAPCSIDSAQAFLPTIDLQPDKDKKELKPSEVLPPDYILPGSKDRSLVHLLVPYQKPLVAVKDLKISPFNPPPGPRKLKGDVIYIDAHTVENRVIHITCCTKGFYVNNSQEDRFDPTQSHSCKTIYQSIVELLMTVSPTFKKTWPLILKQRQEKSFVERLATSYPTASWIAHATRPDSYCEDSIRSTEQTEPFRVGFEDSMPGLLRDWNEELQTTWEMPKKTIAERAIRDRSYFKIHSDFVIAAAKGAQAVIDGNLVAINPGDEKRTHMYIWNNVFFSLGFDVRDHYKEMGGDAAAFAATSADLQGVKAIASLEETDLHILGIAIFDYRGYRVTAQTIIPGILDREQEQSVVYGSIDFGKTVVSDEKYHDLLDYYGKQLRILPHDVISTKNGKEEIVKLYTSYETKGIIGNDGRKYVLDLLRTMPPDVNYLEEAGRVSDKAKELGYPKKFPHKLAALRRELVENFCEAKLIEFVQLTAKSVQASIVEAKEKKEGDWEKLIAEAESELSQAFVDITEYKELKTKNPFILKGIEKACIATHSLYDNRFVIQFNPDCFSKHVKHAPYEDLERQQTLVVEAADYVLTTSIPELVQSFKECSLQPIDGEALAESMHQKGINVRYLGEIAKNVDTTNCFVRPLVLSEIVVRSAKHILRKINNQTETEQLAASYAHILNCLFSIVGGEVSPNVNNLTSKKNNKKNGKKRASGVWSGLSTASLWKSIVEEASSYFGYSILSESLDKFFELHEIQKTAVLRRICRVLGLQIVARDYQLDSSPTKKVAVFNENDIVNLYPVIKHHQPHTIDAKKMFHRGQHAMSMGAPREAYECIAESVNFMTAVYGVMHPDMPQTLRSFSRLSHVLGDTTEALNHQHKATIMSERLIGLDSGMTIIEYISLAHFTFCSLLIPGSLRPLYRARYLLNLTFGEKHPVMAQIDANIGTILFTLQEFDLALKYLQSADQISKAIGEPLKLKTGLIMNLIARSHASRGDFRAALVAEKETYNIFSQLLGPKHQQVKESMEYLKTLTQQAVMFQKKMMEAKNSTSISELFQIQAPPVSSIFEILNVINGIMFIGLNHFVTSNQAERLQQQQNGAIEENKENKSENIESKLEDETLD